MKRFLLRIGLLFIFLNIAAFVCQEAIFVVMRHVETGDFGAMNDIDSGRINAKLLFCGSSRAYVQYDPEVFEEYLRVPCYNLGINGSGLEVQFAVLKWYLEKNKPPCIIVQNIDIFGGEGASKIYQPYRYLPYLKSPGLFEALSRIDKNLWLHRLLPLANLAYFNKSFQKELLGDVFRSVRHKANYLYKGYASRDRRQIDPKYEEIFLRDHAGGIHYSISKEIEAYLLQLIALCKDHHISLVLVFAPEYVRFMDLQTNRSEIAGYYSDLCRSQGIAFIDYSDSDLCRKREYFYNFTHLNSDGALAFSRDLAQRMKDMGLGTPFSLRARSSRCDQVINVTR